MRRDWHWVARTVSVSRRNGRTTSFLVPEPPDRPPSPALLPHGDERMGEMKAPTWNLHGSATHRRVGAGVAPQRRLLTASAAQRIVALALIAALVVVAMLQLDVIAAESRAIGMPGHDAARDYLVDQLALLGLDPQLQTTTAVMRFEGADAFNTGTVTNVIARIPGTESTGAIALNAHYDGGDTGPAASDNGSGVVTVLETVRALLAGPAFANDVIIV